MPVFLTFFFWFIIFQLSSYDSDSTEVEERQQFRIEVVVSNQNVSTGSTAYNIILSTPREAFRIDYQNNFIPDLDLNSGGLNVENNVIELRQDTLESKCVIFCFVIL